MIQDLTRSIEESLSEEVIRLIYIVAYAAEVLALDSMFQQTVAIFT